MSRIVATPATTKPSKDVSVGCCARVGAEFRHRPYSSEEPVSGRMIHGPNTFGPKGLWILALKAGLTLWAVSVFFQGFLQAPGMFHLFFLAYLTNWTYGLACIYLLSSCYHTLQSTILFRSSKNTNVTWSHTFTWALFSVAAPGEIVVTLGYWGLEWDGTSSAFFYRNIMIHGVIVAIVLIDGLILNRIPIRLTQYGVLLLYLTAYLIWTVVYELAEIGNPYTEGEDSDDQLYSSLNWTESPVSTTVAAAQLLFVVVPIAFAMVYILSLYSFPCGGCTSRAHRRYINDAEESPNVRTPADNGSSKTAYVEMSSMV